jgi:hypothetical protein
MLLLVLGVFRAMPAAKPTRGRHALAVLVFAFLLLSHALVSLHQKHDSLKRFSDGPTYSP